MSIVSQRPELRGEHVQSWARPMGHVRDSCPVAGHVQRLTGACPALGRRLGSGHVQRPAEGMSRGVRRAPAGTPALDSSFAVGKHGPKGTQCKVERSTLNFNTSMFPEGALFGRQIHHQEPGGSRGSRHERLDGGEPPARTRPPAQGADGPARGCRRRAPPRHRGRPGCRQRPGEHRHQGPSRPPPGAVRAAAAAVPHRAAGHQERPERGRAARRHLRLHRAPAAGPRLRKRRRREADARRRRLPRGAARRPAGRPRRPQGGQRGPRKLLPGAGEVRHRPHRDCPLGQAGPGDRPRRRDPPHHPGPEPPHQEQPRHHRRTRRRQDRRRRRPGPADRGRRRPREPARQDPDRPGPRLHGGRRQVPRRIRGAAQGRAGGNQELRGPDRHVHRRAPHRGRGRRHRGQLHGRRQHAQAHAGPRRAAPDRRHHAGRVPREHREGPRPGTPLPAGLRRRAQRGGHHRHPARAQGTLRGAPQGRHRRLRPRRRRHALQPLHLRPAAAGQGDRPRGRGRVPAAHGDRLRPGGDRPAAPPGGPPDHGGTGPGQRDRSRVGGAAGRDPGGHGGQEGRTGRAQRPLGGREGGPEPCRRPQGPDRRTALRRREVPARRRPRGGLPDPLRRDFPPWSGNSTQPPRPSRPGWPAAGPSRTSWWPTRSPPTTSPR